MKILISYLHALDDRYMFIVNDNTEKNVGKGILSHFKSFMHSDDMRHSHHFGLAYDDFLKLIR